MMTEDTLIRAVDLVVAVTGKDRYEASLLLEELKVDVLLRPSSGGWRVKLLRYEDALKLVTQLDALASGRDAAGRSCTLGAPSAPPRVVTQLDAAAPEAGRSAPEAEPRVH